MNRKDFQQIARRRVKEARTLLDRKYYEGAYYLLGYSIECAIKSCIAKQFKRYEFPDKKYVNNIWTHDLERLIDLAGLKSHLHKEITSNLIFASNWATIKDWNENSRYEIEVSKKKARDLYSAVTSRKNGVLIWLTRYW